MRDRAARDENLLRRARSGRARVGTWLTLACLIAACSKSTPPAPKPFRGPGIGPIMQDAVDPLDRPRPSDPGLLLPAETIVSTANLAQPAPERKDATDKEPRDYPAELLQRLGNPASCLAQRTYEAKLAALSIGITAQLMPSGALARTELSAPQLSGAERACLAQRVGAVRLAGPIDGAPLGIQATLTLQPTAAKTAAAPGSPKAETTQAMPEAREGSAFLEPSPEAKEVPAAPPVQITGEGTTP